MEDADSDSGFDSDGDWYHAGRDIVYGLRTNSNAVGPPTEKKKGGTRWGCLSFLSPICPQVGGESQKLLGILIFHPCHRDSWRWL